MINKMSKHTHDITISTLLSTHALVIYKQNPIPNPSFPIYQMIQHVTKNIDNCQLVQKLDYSLVGFTEESKTKFNRVMHHHSEQHNRSPPPPPQAFAYITYPIFLNNTGYFKNIKKFL